MLKSVIDFVRSEDGAVTVDWVALTGVIALAGLAIGAFIYNEGITPLAETVADNINTAEIPGLNDPE